MRIYPKPMKRTQIRLARYAGNRYIDVVLLKNKSQLREALGDKEVLAQYSPEPYAIYPKVKIGKKLGTIYLQTENIGVGILSHEVLHCVFDWYDKFHQNGNLRTQADQEKACWLQGDLMRKIVLWLLKIGAYPETTRR